uniref:LDL receptor related protein associated protein 1 n=1 Tax=Phocoena sinus TaxID=42100 RepID=A0A8C9AZU9_PHOSS
QTCEAGPKGSPGDAEPVLPHHALPRGSGQRDRPEARGPKAASVRGGVAGGGSPGLFALLPLGPKWAGELGGRRRGGPQTTASSPSRALLVILAKYGLDGRKDARAISSNSISHGPADHSLEDPRLEKLWHKVPSHCHPPWRRQALAFGFLPLHPLVKGSEGRELGLSTPPGSKGPAWPAGVIHRGTRVTNPRWAWGAGCTPRRGQVGSAYGGTPRRGQVSTAHGGVHWRWLSFQAKTSGKFSSEELDKLWRELQHHKEKVHEYNVLLETLSRTEEIHENVISPVDVSRVKEDALQVGHAELKDKLRDISQGFDRLRRVSHQGYGDQAGFEEPRVLDLWDMAQSANFTEKELEAFREELKHFEAKIEKHNHYQKQLEISHQKLKHVESLGDQEHVSRNRERYAVLEEKTKELGYKVKKHLQDLSSRISRARHNEL